MQLLLSIQAFAHLKNCVFVELLGDHREWFLISTSYLNKIKNKIFGLCKSDVTIQKRIRYFIFRVSRIVRLILKCISRFVQCKIKFGICFSEKKNDHKIHVDEKILNIFIKYFSILFRLLRAYIFYFQFSLILFRHQYLTISISMVK